MAKSKTVKTSAAAADPAAHAVPRPNPAMPPKAKTSVIDRFRSKTVPTTTKVKDDDRPVVKIDEETQEQFVNFAAASEIYALAEERKKSLSVPLIDAIFDRYVDALWNTKRKPQNPNIKASVEGKLEATGMFVISTGARIQVPMPQVNEGEPLEDAMIRSLTEIGISRINAANFVTTEVSFVPGWSLNFTETLQSQDDFQREAAEILFCVINGEDADGNALDHAGRLQQLKSISDNGWDALREKIVGNATYVPSLVDGEGFLDRICNYVDNREELGKLLSLFKPTKGFRSVKFAVMDNETVKKQRLWNEAKTVVGA
jgi:hypothetical protein